MPKLFDNVEFVTPDPVEVRELFNHFSVRSIETPLAMEYALLFSGIIGQVNGFSEEYLQRKLKIAWKCAAYLSKEKPCPSES